MPAVPPFRVVHISDTHLSPEAAWFVPNFDAMVAIVSRHRPDLVVNTGDIALDGARREDDLAFARRCHDLIDARWVALPGNHDLGDNPWRPGLAQPITDERRARYRRHFGDDHWLIDAGEWVLLGVNAQLFGSGLAAEDEQWEFVASAGRRAGGRPVALFVHKPLFKEDPGETAVEGRYVPPDSRRRLATALGGADVRLVASGHVHQHRQHRVDGVSYSWAPSTAFVLPDRRQPRIGVKRVGYVAYTFDAGTVAIETVEPPELTNHDTDQFPDLYG
jgi:3',5'-cyclic AMP phosphodiesterase CpdA